MQAKTEHKGKTNFIGNSFRGIINRLKPKNERSSFSSKLTKTNHSETDNLDLKKNKGKEKEIDRFSSTTDSSTEEIYYPVKLRPKKTVKAPQSIKLNSLITEQSTPELWRKTSVYQVMEQFNGDAVERFSNFPWYTQQAVITFLTTQQQITFHPIKNKQISIIKQMLEQLDKGYQKYLEETNDEFNQAGALAQYLRACIESLFSDDFEDVLPLASAIYHDGGLNYLPQMEFHDEQLEYHLRAFFQAQLLCLHRASSSPTFNEVLPYLIQYLEVPAYNLLLAQLIEKTAEASYLSTQNKQFITGQRLAMDAGKVPQKFVSLRAKILPDNEAFRTAVISALSLDFYQTNNIRPAKFPKCSTEEADFFIPKDSTLEKRLSATIENFSNEYRKCKLESNSNLIKPVAKNMATQLKAVLLDDDHSSQYEVNSPSLVTYG
ncbi:hypothetical protein [Legionella drozanskii]|uniref:Uncharacterized protein n=1 Tax=Legionella drozanskii LLAP-1 TaxID=1212489 RepID=A0A0W0SV79_9GAMM|nr:hypothetical protein [Legionella drozanskii]KTC87275.1 hypothetical protein Ldro_0894 [Legionella drozanskii LLAP-1]